MKKTRQSNIELLRIVSMLLVLMVHADFTSIGVPSRDLMLSSPGQFTFRVLVEFVSVLCVDIFVIISGWFSIRPSFTGVCNYLWQCLYFSAGIYVVLLLCGMASFSAEGLLGIFYLDNDEWFVKAYLALMILAPVLNTFVDHASRKQFAAVLIAFFIFQTVFSFRGAAAFIQSGYSAFSFIGLYLLARYMRLYCHNITTSQCFGIFTVSVLANAALFSTDVWLKTDFATGICMSYANPLVVIGAMSLTIIFSRMDLGTNKFINYLAGSCFAVYLLHCSHWLFVPVYCTTVAHLYSSFNGLLCVAVIALFIFAVFVLAVLLDQPRRLLWQFITSRINERSFSLGNSAGVQCEEISSPLR